MISTLTAKSNAIKMLHSRLRLLSAYLASLPPCYLNRDISDALSAVLTPDPPLDHTILRAIAAIVTRLRLVVPPSPADPLLPHSSSDTDKVAAVAVSTASLVPTASFAQQKSQQSCDVAVVEMLAAMTRLLQAASEVGRKHAVVRRNNPALKKSGLGLPPAMPSRGIDFWSQSAYSPGAFEDLSVSLASTSAPSKGA